MINYHDIYDLTSLEYEGGFWDFKQEWPSNKARLLHDIICMANNLVNREGLIIVGVTDDYEIVGTMIKDKNRKTTQQLNDFLKRKTFVGGNRPMVRVERVLCGGSIKTDVIIVENSKNTPFVLAEDYTDHPSGSGPVTIYKGNVYTRVQDTNTAINATADNDKVEALWRKRFRINETPMEKLRYYLSDIDGWTKTDKSGRYEYYYQYAPEYTIDMEPYEDEIERCDFLCKLPPDDSAKYTTVHFKVFGSVIWEWFHVGIDGYRYETVMPNSYGITVDDVERKFLFITYIVEGSLSHLFFKFIRGKDESSYLNHRYQEEMWTENVVFFRSENEKDRFIQHVKDNSERIWDEYEKVEDYRYSPDDKDGRVWTLGDSQDWKSAQVLVKEYHEWRSGA